MSYKKLRDYIEIVDIRNTDLTVTKLLGVSVKKVFIDSIANTVGTDFKKYKLVRKHQFTYIPDTSRRGDKIGVAMLEEYDIAIVSQAYTVFKIIDENKLNPEYLMMWFRRPEFDRYARFKSHGSVREIFDWDEMCEIALPIPSIEKQNEIVKEYNTIINRINLNETLNQKLEETAQALYKHWFVDFEFPDEDGQPYKSSGGEMVYCEEVDGEVPEGWKGGSLGDLIQLQRGFDLPTQNRIDGSYPIYASTGITEFHHEYKVKAPGIVTGRSGSLGDVFYITEDFWPLNTTLWIKEYKNATPIYSYFVLKGINIQDYNSGSAVPSLNRNYIHMHELIVPNISVIEAFEKTSKIIFKHKKEKKIINVKLSELQALLLSKMTKVQDLNPDYKKV